MKRLFSLMLILMVLIGLTSCAIPIGTDPVKTVHPIGKSLAQ